MDGVPNYRPPQNYVPPVESKEAILQPEVNKAALTIQEILDRHNRGEKITELERVRLMNDPKWMEEENRRALDAMIKVVEEMENDRVIEADRQKLHARFKRIPLIGRIFIVSVGFTMAKISVGILKDIARNFH